MEIREGYAAKTPATHGRSLRQPPVNSFWRTTLREMPRASTMTDPPKNSHRYFTCEKDAINAARKLRVEEVDRLTAEISQLDERYDQIEDAEMKGNER